MCYYWFILDFNMSGYEYNSVRFYKLWRMRMKKSRCVKKENDILLNWLGWFMVFNATFYNNVLLLVDYRF
jgi:hypothetical protein